MSVSPEQNKTNRDNIRAFKEYIEDKCKENPRYFRANVVYRNNSQNICVEKENVVCAVCVKNFAGNYKNAVEIMGEISDDCYTLYTEDYPEMEFYSEEKPNVLIIGGVGDK